SGPRSGRLPDAALVLRVASISGGRGHTRARVAQIAHAVPGAGISSRPDLDAVSFAGRSPVAPAFDTALLFAATSQFIGRLAVAQERFSRLHGDDRAPVRNKRDRTALRAADAVSPGRLRPPRRARSPRAA